MNDFRVFNSADPMFMEPRFQRRILATSRPIPIVENMHEVMFDCGHAPLMFCDHEPAVGDYVFCPDCYEAAKGAA